MKVNVTLNDELMARADAFADENYMSRSGLVSIALTQYLNEREMIGAVKSLAFSIRKIADSGEIDDSLMRDLEDFERLAKMFAGQ